MKYWKRATEFIILISNQYHNISQDFSPCWAYPMEASNYQVAYKLNAEVVRRTAGWTYSPRIYDDKHNTAWETNNIDIQYFSKKIPKVVSYRSSERTIFLRRSLKTDTAAIWASRCARAHSTADIRWVCRVRRSALARKPSKEARGQLAGSIFNTCQIQDNVAIMLEENSRGHCKLIRPRHFPTQPSQNRMNFWIHW